MFDQHRLRALAVMVLPVLLGFGPCGPIAGGQLEGQVMTEQVNDFRFVSEAEQCALEVMDEKAHSVTVNCWAVGKQLFVGCMDCDGKTWSEVISRQPQARIKINNKLYPVRATRMQDPGAIQRAWQYRWSKYEEGEVAPLPEGYWLFHLRSVGRA